MEIGGVRKAKKSGQSRQAGKPRQPKRQKKADRQTRGMHSKEAIMCDYALGPLDRLAGEMDRKWGVDVLTELVSVDTAMKYGSAVAKLNAAIDEGVPEVVAARSEVCQRGLMAMDREAQELGMQPASPDVWEVQADDGEVYAILKDGRSWPTVRERMHDVRLVTGREVALALKFYNDSVAGKMTDEVKKHFPSAEVVKITGKQYDDDIPF